LGKKIVSMLLKGSGYSLEDYGRISIPPLVEKLKRDNLKVCFVSVLMLPSALSVGDLKTALADSGVKTKIVVGGAPFRLDNNLWKRVGADDFGKNSGDALALADRYTKV
jgi:methanogenic corrinoid protein MtbC1